MKHFDSMTRKSFNEATTIIFGIFVACCSTWAQSGIDEGIEFIAQNKLTEAKSFFEEYTKFNINNPDAFYHLGKVYFLQEDLNKAVNALEQAIQLDDTKSDYYLWLGHAYGRNAQNAGVLAKLGWAKKCKSAYEKSIEIDSSNIEARKSLFEYYLNAPGIAGGGIEKAIEQADKIKKFDPIAGHVAFIRVYTKENKQDLVEQEIQEALACSPNNRDMMLELGVFYTNQKKYSEAFACFENRVAQDPEDLSFLYQIGRTAAISGENLKRGEECLIQYLNYPYESGRQPHSAAHWRLGMVYEHLKDIENAKSEYEKALTLNNE